MRGMQERPALWGLHPGTGAVTQLLAMEHLIPPGHKKVPKVYTAACHPTLPHLLAVAANSGDPPLPCSPLPTQPQGSVPSSSSLAVVSGHDVVVRSVRQTLLQFEKLQVVISDMTSGLLFRRCRDTDVRCIRHPSGGAAAAAAQHRGGGWRVRGCFPAPPPLSELIVTVSRLATPFELLRRCPSWRRSSCIFGLCPQAVRSNSGGGVSSGLCVFISTLARRWCLAQEGFWTIRRLEATGGWTSWRRCWTRMGRLRGRRRRRLRRRRRATPRKRGSPCWAAWWTPPPRCPSPPFWASTSGPSIRA